MEVVLVFDSQKMKGEGPMVTFIETLVGYDVHVNGKCFGHITKDQGFFTSRFTIIHDYLPVSSNDLILIAKKAEKVQR